MFITRRPILAFAGAAIGDTLLVHCPGTVPGPLRNREWLPLRRVRKLLENAMPLTLVRRAGGDTLGKLEAAARRRFREAEKLFAQGEHLGAVYLFGYSIEIRLKAAYYRTIGLVPSSAIEKLHRKPAEDAIDAMHLPRPPLSGRSSPGHDIVGWALLLEQARAAPGNIPMDPAVAARMRAHADDVFLCWVEFLRYRANKPYNEEVATVRNAARWFRANAARLWR